MHCYATSAPPAFLSTPTCLSYYASIHSSSKYTTRANLFVCMQPTQREGVGERGVVQVSTDTNLDTNTPPPTITTASDTGRNN